VLTVSSVQVVAVPPLQTPEPASRFDVASIKVNNSPSSSQRISAAGNRFVATNVTVQDMLSEAFGKQPTDILNVPDWATSRRFDIQGVAAGTANWQQMLVMVQSLLAERFALSSHRELRDGPAFALVVDGRRPRMKEVAAESCTPPAAGCGGFRADPGKLTGRRVTPAQLARMLSGPRTGRLVLDRTGLNGFFDFELSWTPDVPNAGRDGVPPPDLLGPSIFTAVREQLGLRLAPISAPIEKLVIDRLTPPTPD
jgi:uncharacterized protein (TIGR03435 family)